MSEDWQKELRKRLEKQLKLGDIFEGKKMVIGSESEMKIMCSRCDKEVENASPYNFFVLHKECFRDHAEKLIDEFLEDLKYAREELLNHYNYNPQVILMQLEKKWEAKKSEV